LKFSLSLAILVCVLLCVLLCRTSGNGCFGLLRLPCDSSILSMSGSRYARVFPEPASAMSTRSRWVLRSGCHDNNCVSIGLSIPKFAASASTRGAAQPSSAKLSARTGASLTAAFGMFDAFARATTEPLLRIRTRVVAACGQHCHPSRQVASTENAITQESESATRRAPRPVPTGVPDMAGGGAQMNPSHTLRAGGRTHHDNAVRCTEFISIHL
jgi:hypothetical protein